MAPVPKPNAVERTGGMAAPDSSRRLNDVGRRDVAIAGIDALRAKARPWRPGEPLAEDLVRRMRDDA